MNNEEYHYDYNPDEIDDLFEDDDYGYDYTEEMYDVREYDHYYHDIADELIDE